MTDQLENFKFSHPIQMRWKDMDALGHVNNATMITYFEIARSQYMIESCPGWDWRKNMFLIVNVTCNYHRELPLTATDVKVWIRGGKFGTKSFVLEYVATSEKNGETIIHASGTTTQVFFDMVQKKSIAAPEWVKEAIEKFDRLR